MQQPERSGRTKHTMRERPEAVGSLYREQRRRQARQVGNLTTSSHGDRSIHSSRAWCRLANFLSCHQPLLVRPSKNAKHKHWCALLDIFRPRAAPTIEFLSRNIKGPKIFPEFSRYWWLGTELKRLQKDFQATVLCQNPGTTSGNPTCNLLYIADNIIITYPAIPSKNHDYRNH